MRVASGSLITHLRVLAGIRTKKEETSPDSFDRRRVYSVEAVLQASAQRTFEGQQDKQVYVNSKPLLLYGLRK